MVRDGEGGIYAGNLRIPVDAFIKLCKENGANPSSMLCTLLAKAAYDLNPGIENDLVFDVTISVRKFFGMEKSLANSVGLAVSYVTREDMRNKSIAEVSQKIRKDVDGQRTRDYFITLRRFFASYKHARAFKARTVTYIGSLNVGDNNHHIVDFDLGTNSISNLFMMQVNDSFAISLHHGKATEKYMNAFIRIFSDLGIKAEITHPAHRVVLDSKTPVL
jgi:hypothetical protein